MSYATIADLKALSGDDQIADNDDRALRLLAYADAKIDEYCGRTFPIAPATTVLVIVTAVAGAMAARSWVNPKGANAINDVAGISTLQTSWGSSGPVPSVPLALRASEKDDLSNYKVRRSGIGTIATERPLTPSQEFYVGSSATYLDVVGGGDPFPWPNPDAL